MRVALAALALAGAGVASLLALDVGRLSRTVAVDDTRYQLAPAQPRWQPATVLPSGVASRLLGLEDDLAYRRALQRLAALEAGQYDTGGRDFAVLITRAQRGLIEVSQTDPDPRRRSEATNALGVFAVANPGGYSGFANQDLAPGIRSFRAALILDPSNQAAKRNLEIVLRGLRRNLVPLEREGSGGERLQGGGAGVGQTGRGY